MNEAAAGPIGPYETLLNELSDLLRVAYPDDDKRRESLSKAMIAHECRNLGLSADSAASEQQWETMIARCRYYAAQELLSLHCARQIGWAVDQREDLMLYLQDQLMRDDFRRLGLYQPERGASLRTWLSRVLDNLTRDFLRRASSRGKVVMSWRESAPAADSSDATDALSAIPDSESPSASDSLAQDQMSAFLKQVFSSPPEGEGGAGDGMRDRLAAVLELAASERLFLKLIYFSDLNPEDAGTRIGMNKNQSYGLQRRLLQRIANACKEAGLWDDICDLLDMGAVRLEVICDGKARRLSPDQLRHIAKDSANRCVLWWADSHEADGQRGDIEQAFGTLHRRLYGQTSLIQSAECVADAHVLTLDEGTTELTVRNLTQGFSVHQRYIKVIRGLLRQNVPVDS